MPTDWAAIARDMERTQRPAATPPGSQDGTGGLVIPGANGPYQPPQRELTLGQIGNIGLHGIGAALDIPRLLAYNAGPAMVGRAGQGPQTGADALQRAGILQGSHGQRAIAAGLGTGLDLLANPLNLLGMGAGKAAVNPLTARLERMAGGGLQGAEQAAANRVLARPLAGGQAGEAALARARVVDPNNMPPVATARPRGPVSESLPATIPGGVAPASPTTVRRPGQLPFDPPADPLHGINRTYRDPIPPGTPGSVQGFAHDADALRRMQLNSPHFNPAEPAFGLGTGQFTQDASQAARYGLGEYNPLTTSAAGSPPASLAQRTLADRLRQFSQQPSAPPPSGFGGIQVDSEGTPIVRSLADQLRIQQRQGLSTQPLGGFRGATLPNGPINY